MPIDVCSLIEGDDESNPDGFVGAVFLTYTLSLTFYEGIVSRSLDQAACSNILILADPSGYHDAIRVGYRSIRNAGMRYVCVPLRRSGPGVIHTKAILLLGPNRGRLIVGSGNLTLPGFGRNLELFSKFDYESRGESSEALYLIRHVWSLVEHFEAESVLPSAARRQLDAVRAQVTWLDEPAALPPNLRMWDSRGKSIWAQFTEWRRSRPSGPNELTSLVAVSPFLDPDLAATKAVLSELTPSTALLCTDPSSARWGESSGRWLKNQKRPPLDVASFTPAVDFQRRLHAKALVGIERDGAWCLHGSANLTQPGLMRSWSDGGNLEIAVLQWSPDPAAYNYLLDNDAFQVTPLDPASLTGELGTTPTADSKAATHLVITDLSYSRHVLNGQVGPDPLVCGRPATVRFLKSGATHLTTIDAQGAFCVPFGRPLETSEAACVQVGEETSAYRWIDQPDALARFSERTYQAQIQARLETPSGSNELFRELMDFLWQRFTHEDAEGGGPAGVARRHAIRRSEEENGSDEIEQVPPPPPEEFITDEELLQTIEYRVGLHLPYDRNLWSLRDLLSIVLLRLTATVSRESAEETNGSRDEEEEEGRTRQLEAARLDAQERLCRYIRGYCRKYSTALGDPELVRNAGSDVLFENHFTLGRVLLEAQSKLPDHLPVEDLWEVFWRLWAPLAWPASIGSHALPVLQVLLDSQGSERVLDAWRRSGVGTMTAVFLGTMMEEPPAWDEGANAPDIVEEFMLVRQLVEKLRSLVGPGALDINPDQLDDAVGYQRAAPAAETADAQPAPVLNDWGRLIARMATYLPPSEERLAPFLSLVEKIRSGRGGTADRERAIQEATRMGLGGYVQVLLDGHAPISRVQGEDTYCPHCYLELTESCVDQMHRAKVVMCSSCRHAFLYWRPEDPTQAI